MIYKGLFKDASDIIHTITINTPIGSGTLEMVLCASPFIEEMDADDDIFKPIKYTGATIKVLIIGLQNYMFDVYQSDVHSVLVTLESEGLIEWIGYTTPNLYTLGYDYDKEEIEIECIDGLSALQYIKYTPCSEQRKVRTFKEIIDHILGDYTPYSLNVELPPIYKVNDITAKLLNYTVSEENFFGEDEEDTWTCLEVLEEIFRYLNLTAIALGNEVKLLHYATIAASGQIYDVDADSYCENNNRISLDKTFNKVTVVSKLNTFDYIIPSVFDEKYLTNWNGDWRNISVYYFNKRDGQPYYTDRGYYNAWEARYKFLKNSNYETHYYNKNTKAEIAAPTVMNYDELRNTIGATLMQCNFQEVDRSNPIYPYESLAELAYTNYILIHLHDIMAKLPVFTTKVSNLPEIYLGNNAKIILNCSISIWDREGNMTKLPLDYKEKEDKFDLRNLYLEALLKWGDYYYNNYRLGSDPRADYTILGYPGEWTTTPSTFRIFFDVLDRNHLNGKEFNIINTNGYNGNLGLQAGYIIPIPEGISSIASAPEITIYTRDQRIISNYRLDCIWLKDFNIRVDVAKNPNIKDEDWLSDTEYTNIINENYVNEGSKRDCKINTWDNKKPTYSVVVYRPDSGSPFYLDTVKCVTTDLTIRHEEHIIYNLVTLYRNPAKILELNLKERLPSDMRVTENNDYYIINGYSKDYELCANNYTLVQWNL